MSNEESLRTQSRREAHSFHLVDQPHRVLSLAGVELADPLECLACQRQGATSSVDIVELAPDGRQYAASTT